MISFLYVLGFMYLVIMVGLFIDLKYEWDKGILIKFLSIVLWPISLLVSSVITITEKASKKLLSFKNKR